MLLELCVENLAIIDRATLSFGPGLTVLTGETGAGKSLLVDAIELALGSRADSSLVRSGTSRAVVSAAFDLTGRPDVADTCRERGVDVEQGVLFVQREVAAEGRSQCRIGGRLVPLATLREIGLALVDFHGQHDHQSLLHPERHVEFLDAYAQNDQLRQVVRSNFDQLSAIRSRLQALQVDEREREYRVDLLSFQISEIEEAAVRLGETENLESQVLRLKHSERLANGCHEALSQLRDGERSANDQVASSVRSLRAAARIDPSLDQIISLLEMAIAHVGEASSELASYLSTLEADPIALESAEERLAVLRRLHRKYGGSDAAVIEFAANAARDLSELSGSYETIKALQIDEAAAQQSLERSCLELGHNRAQVTKRFQMAVQDQLRDLAMASAKFEVAMARTDPTASGWDDIEFRFSANEGEPMGSLARIASGGEISRVMLAIKVALAAPTGAPTVVFDEVDSGLGGNAATMVAQKLCQLGEKCQVLAISHLPQIASRASSHYRVRKHARDGRTRVEIVALSSEERIEEVARMLSGDADSSALAHARQILSGS